MANSDYDVMGKLREEYREMERKAAKEFWDRALLSVVFGLSLVVILYELSR